MAQKSGDEGLAIENLVLLIGAIIVIVAIMYAPQKPVITPFPHRETEVCTPAQRQQINVEALPQNALVGLRDGTACRW